ncbi:MAG TPA: primosomal protein N' [Tepidisphaeraceae bacterium]|nr:primosomal protein N' [Tepidisphaeraceae bacterium]
MTESPTLFPHLQTPEAQTPAEAGPFAGVALEQSVDRVLDYAIPRKLAGQVHVGMRVRVPLGRKNRPVRGWVVSIQPISEHSRIKNLLAIDDERILVSPPVMQLARWIGTYYAAPLGVVLESVIPAAVKKRIGIGYSSIVRPAQEPQKIQEVLEKTKSRKRRAVLARLLQVEKEKGIDLVRLAGEAGVKPPTVRKLVGLGLVTIRSEVDLPRLTRNLAEGRGDEQRLELNEDQQKAFDGLRPRVVNGGFSVNLLHGVTGSGKTEIYLRCIAEAVERGKRGLVLVPEIALTPQTVARFMARFKRVAVLHSGLSATQRHQFWQQIMQGDADVVVGARSAVFAPLPDLGVIVVDEEHDSSYKQDQAPRYHARDVAIKRAQIENVPIVLGSATPSLEMYRLCRRDEQRTDAKYQYLTLPRRVRGLAMAATELVDMRLDRRHRRGVHLISQRLEHLLRTTLEAGRQAILLLNRRGYSNFVFCSSCQEPIKCKYCDTTMTYHRSVDAHALGASNAAAVHTGQMLCHYCLNTSALPDKCPACGKKLSLFGLGTQRVEEELARKIPDLKFARVDSDSMRTFRDYESILSRFARGELQVILGTQMIAKGLDYPNVTLVGVISGDTALSLPDFRASERTFQLITQVAGRAGRGDAAGRVVVQTFLPDDPTIKMALKQDYPAFAAAELASRREVGLPPFVRMVRIIMRHQDKDELHKISQDLAQKMKAAGAGGEKGVQMRGPMPCAIGRIAGFERSQILLSCERAEPLQEVLHGVRAGGGLAKMEAVAVDVDPVGML